MQEIYDSTKQMKILAKNRRAKADYEIVQTYDAGIVLQWHEVKAIKMDHSSIKEAIIKFKWTELYILNMRIPLYSKTHPDSVPWYKETAERKLLLNKLELNRIYSKVNKTWMTIVPLILFEAKNRRIKLTIGVGKLRRKVEKKQVIKDRDTGRQMDRQIKNLGL